MSLSRLLVFVIGLILAVVGLFITINNWHDVFSLVVGLLFIVIGVVLVTGRVLSL